MESVTQRLQFGEKIKAAIKYPSSVDKNMRFFVKFQIFSEHPILGTWDVGVKVICFIILPYKCMYPNIITVIFQLLCVCLAFIITCTLHMHI